MKKTDKNTAENAEKFSLGALIASFLKIGVIGFGGGSALIPVVERELVETKKKMSPTEYLKHVVVANITPGALPPKLGATCGLEMNGAGGSVLGAYSVTLPGVLLTVLIMALFSSMGTAMIDYFSFASVGISAFIVFLLVNYVAKVVNSGEKRMNMLLCIFALILTCGGEVRHMLSLFGVSEKLLGTPVFDISTIHLMIITFWMIVFYIKSRSRAEIIFGFLACVVYAFFAGKMGAKLGISDYSIIVLAGMVAVLLVLIIARRSPRAEKTARKAFSRKAVVAVALFIGVPVAASLFTGLVFFGDAGVLFKFLGNLAISTITSFGGGEAYVSVADGFFVGEYISANVFYTQLVPVANALPGPILAKIAAGIGYVFGLNYGSAAGWMTALCAMLTALGVCCTVAVVVMQVYDAVKDSAFITNLKKYILPVICGMLLSTSLSMIYEAMKITGTVEISAFLTLPVMILWIAFLWFLHKKFKIHDLILLLGSAGVSFGVLFLI